MKNTILTVFSTLVILVIGTAFAQQGEQGSSQRKIQFKQIKIDADDTTPVTEGEARETFEHLMKALPSITGPKVNVGSCTIPSSNKPVTRQEIISEMDRLYEVSRPFFKLTPRPIWFDPKSLAVSQGSARTAVEKLAKRGFIATASTLATGKADTVTVAHFGDDVGIFVARIADLTHMPDPKYSPTLMADGPP